MKRIILIMIFLTASLLNGFSQSERITYSPDYRSSECKYLSIRKIEITQDFTIITMTLEAPDEKYSSGNGRNPNDPLYRGRRYWGCSIRFKKGYLKAEADDSKYKLIKSDISEERYLEASEDLEFNLYFKPLKKGVEKFDIMGGSFEYPSSSKINFFGVKINNPLNDLPIANNDDRNKEIIKTGGNTDFASDVDQNIPVNNISNDETFALVIGNETYSNEIKVKYALHDATVFRQYLQKTLGLPDNNIQYIENATFGQILDALNWINAVAKAYTGQAKIIFYYAGHGMPDEQTKSAFLLPIDGNSQNPATAISLSDIYRKLTEYPSVSVTVFLDACFSGSTREIDGEMLAEGRGVKIKPKNELLTGNLVVFTAATGDETAFPYIEKQHGMFTYFLLKKLQDSNGKTTLNELGNYLITNVSQKSVVINKKLQTPQVNTSSQVQDTWQTLKLR
jgi:hypothetical protein